MARQMTQRETAKMVNDYVREDPEARWSEIAALSDDDLQGLRRHLANSGRISADLTAIVAMIQRRREDRAAQ